MFVTVQVKRRLATDMARYNSESIEGNNTANRILGLSALVVKTPIHVVVTCNVPDLRKHLLKNAGSSDIGNIGYSLAMKMTTTFK